MKKAVDRPQKIRYLILMNALHNYMDGTFIREATEQEYIESEEQAKLDGGYGVIIVEVNGKPLPCYVEL